ncbi:MAG TPA: SAM-dependent methyltransferase, partial [Gemmatimonadaceae bacterium]
MKADRPSRTAHFVATGRAVAQLGISHVPDFHDPTARAFLSEKGAKAVAKIEQNVREGKQGWRMEAAKVMADIMALRTTAIDTAVRDAIGRGAKQLVILGAGYDGRAWRMTELAGVRVFEVDHPATQGEKRSRAAELPPAIGSLSFVPINFESQALGDVLTKAGHDRSAPTCWIWEGVVMYLSKESVRSTLRGIAALSAPGSTLIVNYHSPARRFLSKLMVRLIGEPMISEWTPEEMAAELKAAGLTFREDTG